ncbi:MAG: hypothetical protein HOI95_26150, partial [Chromatiales bacterium]|nr:hypothetical protein [Chromatiales bacterium]
VVSVAGVDLSDEVIESIVGRSDGVPLFVEEVTRGLVEAGKSSSGTGDIAELDSLDVPRTLYDSLMSRLDRVPASREIAQCAAAIGREFPYDLLRDVYPHSESRLQTGLHELQASGLILGSNAEGEQTYSFKHALIQDTAYQSVLKRNRRTLHGRIAEVLVNYSPAMAATDSAVIAHHYSRADMTMEAITAWRVASRKAIEQSNFAEAVADAQSGLEMVTKLEAGTQKDAWELELQLRRGRALLASSGWSVPQTGAAYERALELSRQQGDARLFPVMYGLYTFYLVRGEYVRSLRVAHQCIEHAGELGDAAFHRLGLRWRGLTLLLQGNFPAARQDLDDAMEAEDVDDHRASVLNYGTNPRSSTQVFLALCDAFEGKREAALERAQDAVRYADELSSPFDMCHQLSWASFVYTVLDEPERLNDASARLQSVAKQHGLYLWDLAGRIYCAMSALDRGEASAVETFNRSIDAYLNGLGAKHMVILALCEFAKRLSNCGQSSLAGPVLEQATELLDSTGERAYEAELLRVKAEMSAQSVKDKERLLTRSLQLAQERGMGLVATRAARSLATIHESRGDLRRRSGA